MVYLVEKCAPFWYNSKMNEFSAGGVIVSGSDILLVKVKNLSGKIVWTFPKGHIEKGETAAAAALREVLEETGYSCEITRPLSSTRYTFTFGEKRINKRVDWFLMRPIKKVGSHDHEILTVKWFGMPEAGKMLKYATDLSLLSRAAGTGTVLPEERTK